MKIDVSGTKNNEAGQIDIGLKDEGNAITVQGSHPGQLLFNEELKLIALGRHGIDGTIGFDGTDGISGTDGANATEYSRGGNGGNGGDGGHGGAGTNGGNAGNGGTIEVRVEEEDLALLTIINNYDVSAGTPGSAGRHGRGGQGGRAGRGGFSYSWITYSTTYRTEYYHGHDGQGLSHVVADVVPESHCNPGGYDGATGKRGGSHHYPLYPGEPGEDGNVYFHLMNDGQLASTHNEPYKLSVETIDLVAKEESGLFEPGDTVAAIYKIKNNAPSMPSPKEDIPLMLSNQPMIEIIEQGLVAGSIPAGSERVSNETPNVFKIKVPVNYSSSEPYSATIKLAIHAQNTRLNRPFTNALTEKFIDIRYPVTLLPQATHFSIAREQSQLLQATVNNISQKALGCSYQRKVIVEIADESNTPLMSNNILNLQAQATYQTSEKVGFEPHAEFGTQLQFYANLYLQPIDRSQNATLIQQQPLTIQLTPTYKPSENGFALIINAETSPVALKYWTKMLEEMAGNSGVAIWNTSYYGHFSLDGNLNDKFTSTLQPSILADTSHGTIVVLNNSYQHGQTHSTHQNSQFITPSHLLQAHQTHNTSLLVVGDKGVLPEPYRGDENSLNWNEKAYAHGSIDEFIRDLLTEEFPPVFYHKIEVSLKGLFFNKTLSGQLEYLRTSLTKTFPNRGYHISIDENSSSEHRVIIKVRRLADSLHNKLHKLGLTDEELINPTDSDIKNKKELIDALPFTQKLKFFADASNQYHQFLAQSITKDLLKEQEILRRTNTYGTWWQLITKVYQHNFLQELKQLQSLVHCLNQFAKENDAANFNNYSPLVIQMIAEVQYHAEQHSSFWSRLANWFITQPNVEITRSTLGLCQQALTSHSKLTNTPMAKIEEASATTRKCLHFEHKLQCHIEQCESQSSSCCFFSAKKLSYEYIAAAKQLQQVYLGNAEPQTLEEYKDAFKNRQLKKFYDELTLLYPSLPANEVKIVLA